MEIFTGIDIIEISRFRALSSFERVAEFILSSNERELMQKSRDRFQFLASRFALKEAVIKAVPEEATLSDLEILSLGARPRISWQKPALKGYKVSASLSHTENLVAATAVIIFNQ